MDRRKQFNIRGLFMLTAALVLVGWGVAALAQSSPPVPMVGGGAPSPAPPSGNVVERTVAIGEKFDVRLDANATTGYSWAVEPQMSQGLDKLAQNGETYELASQDANRAGAPGVQVFQFAAVTPGNVRVVFVYRRPWVPNVYERVSEVRILIR